MTRLSFASATRGSSSARGVAALLGAALLACGGGGDRPTAPDDEPDGPAPVGAAGQLALVDYDNAGDASDFLVRFRHAAREAGILEYRAMLVPAAEAEAFDTAAARAVPADRYASISTSGATGELRFDATATDVNGDPVTPDGSYAVTIYSAVSGPDFLPAVSEPSNAVALGVTNLVRTLAGPIDAGSGGLDTDADGNVYTADFGTNLGTGNTPGTRVHRITPTGEVSVFATGLQGASGNDFDSQGNLMQSNIAGGTVSRIAADGSKTTFVTGLRGPVGIVAVENDTLYVVNCSDDTIDRVDPEGNRETWVGGNPLNCPNGITRGDDGNLYVANFYDGNVIEVAPDGTMQVHATLPGSNNGHLLFGNGVLYVVARSADQIYEVGLDGAVSLLAGSGTRGLDDGAALTATLSRPNDLALSPDGKILYFNDVANTTDATGLILNPVVVRMVLLEGDGS